MRWLVLWDQNKHLFHSLRHFKLNFWSYQNRSQTVKEFSVRKEVPKLPQPLCSLLFGHGVASQVQHQQMFIEIKIQRPFICIYFFYIKVHIRDPAKQWKSQ